MSFLYLLEEIRNPVLDLFFSIITLFGQETLFMAAGMIAFWCVDKFKGYYLLCIGFFGTLLNQFLKITCRVPRPWVKDPDFTVVGNAKKAAGGYSFPSGHTQISTGLYGGVARIAKKKPLRIAMILLALLVAFSRMYLGVHTPADIFVSVGIGTVLVLFAHPIFKKAEKNPKVMFAVIFTFLAAVILYLFYVLFFPFPAEVYEKGALENLLAAQKNGFTLLGCVLGFGVVYTADSKWIRFETRATLPIQIIKVLGGLALVLFVREVLRAPLDALFDGHLFARTVRYFLMVVTGGTLWPLAFPFLNKISRTFFVKKVPKKLFRFLKKAEQKLPSKK